MFRPLLAGWENCYSEKHGSENMRETARSIERNSTLYERTRMDAPMAYQLSRQRERLGSYARGG